MAPTNSTSWTHDLSTVLNSPASSWGHVTCLSSATQATAMWPPPGWCDRSGKASLYSRSLFPCLSVGYGGSSRGPKIWPKLSPSTDVRAEMGHCVLISQPSLTHSHCSRQTQGDQPISLSFHFLSLLLTMGQQSDNRPHAGGDAVFRSRELLCFKFSLPVVL